MMVQTAQMVQAWMLQSLPIVEWRQGDRAQAWPELRHANTRVREGRGDRVLSFGDTVWLGEVDGQRVGMGWEWIEIRPGVLLLSDPNTICSNLSMLDDDSRPADELKSITMLNNLVHHLQWQGSVHAIIKANSHRNATAQPRLKGTATKSKYSHNTHTSIEKGVNAEKLEPALR
jgi:hypothetical protein